MADKLTAKQKAFCQEYLVDLNATQAAIRAGYSEDTARSIGCENLTKPDIQDFISQLQKERSERTQITADMVVQELAKIGFSDARNIVDDDNRLKKPSEWDDNLAGAISSIEFGDVTGMHKVKMWDKNAALEKLAKHLGMYAPEKHELSGKDGGPIGLVTEIKRTIVRPND